MAEPIRSSGASTVGERKLVTVMFCDLVGSTAIAERLDPEEYRELLDRYLEVTFREVYGVEGVVNHLAGDGVMALFGAPLAREDAPGRAVRAALAIRQRLAELPIEGAGGAALRVRIGINTGPVVVGPVGSDLKMDYSAVGDTSNLAARLQALAGPGEILISETTHRLLRGFVEARRVGPVAVKGKSAPIVAYEVVRLHKALSPIQAAAGRGLTPLIGRREEVEELVACYRRLAGGQAQVAAIVGDAGSGKSRLLYEFKERLTDEGVNLFEGRCSPLMHSQPYAGVADMLRRYFGVTADEEPSCVCEKVSAKVSEWDERLDRIYPFLCRLLSAPVGDLGGVRVEEMKERTFEAVARLVMSLSERMPVVMILEDLHWADDASLELIGRAVSALRNARVMLAVSHRPEYTPLWRPAAPLTQLSLSRLSERETAEMVRAIAGGPVPEKLERLIHARADGNPFFIEEITRSLIEEGQVVRDGDQIRLRRRVELIRIPDTLRELIAARLDRLTHEGKRVAQVAAIIGRQFGKAQVGRLLEGEGIEVGAALDQLEQRGVIHRKHALSREEYRFGESLTQEVAYESLLLRERRRLHGKVARLLESAPGSPSAERSALIAHHYALSEDRDKAIEALLRAAAEAEELPSYRAASRFYFRAWQLAEGLSGAADAGAGHGRAAVRAALGLCRVAVLYGSGDRAEAERAAERGRQIAQALGDTQSLAHFYAFQGIMATSGGCGGFEEGMALIEAGVDVARREGAALTAAGISRALAWVYLLDGRFDQARGTIEWVIDECDRLGEREKLSDTYFGALFLRDALCLYSDDVITALTYARQTYSLALRAKNRTVQSGSAATLARACFLQARYREAVAWAERGLQTSRTIANLAGGLTAAAVALAAKEELGEEAEGEPYLDLIDEALAEGVGTLLNGGVVVDGLLAAGDLRRAERAADLVSARAGGSCRRL